ncbi:unnamed protein product [Caenorhabditis brenneri]
MVITKIVHSATQRAACVNRAHFLSQEKTKIERIEQIVMETRRKEGEWFTIICNILLFLLCYKLLGNWEVPFHLGFDPFRIVGGFPTLIESFYENLFEKPAESLKSSNFPLEGLQYPVATPKFGRTLNWSCPILESTSECFTVVTSSECLPTSQLSYSFWEEDLSECFHKSKGNIDCKEPFQNGNLCENVVKSVQRSENGSVFFELDDVPINTQIIQSYGEETKQTISDRKADNSTEEMEFENYDYCKNYSIHETVLVGGENDTNIFPVFPFGVNSTNLLEDKACSPPFPPDVFLCNCRNYPECEVPILYLTPNATFCGSTTISIYHSHGFIYSAVVTTSSEESTTPQIHTVLFYDLPQNSPLSKFDLQHGRFHCPSEKSCILEILYPFSYLNSLEIPYQLGILVFSAIIGLLILKKANEQ